MIKASKMLQQNLSKCSKEVKFNTYLLRILFTCLHGSPIYLLIFNLLKSSNTWIQPGGYMSSNYSWTSYSSVTSIHVK